MNCSLFQTAFSSTDFTNQYCNVDILVIYCSALFMYFLAVWLELIYFWFVVLQSIFFFLFKLDFAFQVFKLIYD